MPTPKTLDEIADLPEPAVGDTVWVWLCGQPQRAKVQAIKRKPNEPPLIMLDLPTFGAYVPLIEDGKRIAGRINK